MRGLLRTSFVTLLAAAFAGAPLVAAECLTVCETGTIAGGQSHAHAGHHHLSAPFVAQAIRQPWPIDPGHVALIMEGLAPIVPGWVDVDRARGFTATFEVRLRGQATHVFAFQDGQLRVNPGDPGPIDAHISADPSALLLVLYRRQSQWRHIARGRLLAWGRRPWLALTFVGRFHKP